MSEKDIHYKRLLLSNIVSSYNFSVESLGVELLAESVCNQQQRSPLSDAKTDVSAEPAGRRRRKRGPQQLLK
jgi:hypothetical protein